MITTVTLNSAIDKTYYVNRFGLNQVNRVSQMFAEPGGKGNNVAKVLQTLGIPVTASGFAGGHNGRKISEDLQSLQISHQFVETAGESRICLNIIDEETGSQTEILEGGPEISDHEWQQMKLRIREAAKRSKLIIFSGSLAKGIPADAYKQLVEITQENGAKAVVDTSGQALEEVVSANPFMIKPNREELSKLLGKDEINGYDILDALSQPLIMSIPLVVVSMGEEGAIVRYKENIYKVFSPQIEAVNPVGCGDSLVAGISAGLYQDWNIIDCLILGTAAAAANCLEQKAGNINLGILEDLKKQVRIEKVFL
jgi:tagatose 6-phosphate kinase